MSQMERMEKLMKQLGDQHRQKIAVLESQFLQQKQQLLRSRYHQSACIISYGSSEAPILA